MKVLIDENLPVSMGACFVNRGWEIVHAAETELRSQPDEVLFDYAARHQALVTTRDVRFASLIRFPLDQLAGIVVVRFPQTVSIQNLVRECTRLLADLQEDDFRNLIVVEPGGVRMRPLR